MRDDHPILFNGQMVTRILAGQKTETRRVMRPQPRGMTGSWRGHELSVSGRDHRCPYGAVGDLLWVRETWRPEELPSGLDGIRYAADDAFVPIRNTREAADAWVEVNTKRAGWRPSIHMPRWASRITLGVDGVRVERLHAIDQAGAVAEGFTDVSCLRTVWDGINGKRAGASWDANPWVWVVEFHRCRED